MMPTLRLNRLVVVRGGKRVYDETFHAGLNIIRGSNGSGKSTIMDFIFFALGGELDKWKEYALLCDEVIAEITASDNEMVIRREVDAKKYRPMRIFFGKFDDAIKSAADGWVHAPYARNGNSKSFSQVIFEALKIPEMPGEEGSNISMHQILRLMYVDQVTPFQRIFRTEPLFDTKDIRRAVGELLCGIGGYDLYMAKLKLRTVKAEFDEAKTKLQNFLRATTAIGENLHKSTLTDEIQRLTNKRDQLFQKIKDLETKDINMKDVVNDTEAQRKKLFNEMTAKRSEIIKCEEKLKAIEFELSDSESFISHLNSMLKELESSALTFITLGNMAFERCPVCFGPLKERESEHCPLCGGTHTEKERDAKVLSLKLDIEGQLTESKRLMVQRQEERDSLNSKLSEGRKNLASLTRRLDTISAAPIDGRSALFIEISREIGLTEARVKELEKLKGLSDEIDELSKRKEKLNADLSSLEDLIQSLSISQEKRKKLVLKAIVKETKKLLELDLKKHNDFDKLEEFDFNFEDDWFAINGQPNISTSASGMVVVKNSLFMGILLASLSDELMRFPRFLLLDNVEDKGMVHERIWNFQAVIAEKSKEATTEHQIIITTSSINKDLETNDYVIGPSYTRENRTLKIL